MLSLSTFFFFFFEGPEGKEGDKKNQKVTDKLI